MTEFSKNDPEKLETDRRFDKLFEKLKGSGKVGDLMTPELWDFVRSSEDRIRFVLGKAFSLANRSSDSENKHELPN